MKQDYYLLGIYILALFLRMSVSTLQCCEGVHTAQVTIFILTQIVLLQSADTRHRVKQIFFRKT